MAISLAKLSPSPDHVSGNKKIRYRTVTFDDSYPTAGESLTAANVGLKKIAHVTISGLKNSGGTLGWMAAYDYTNSKILVYTAAAVAGSGTALAEVASTTNLSTYSCVVRIEGN